MMESDEEEFERESGSPSAVTKYLDGIEEREEEKDQKGTKTTATVEDVSGSSSTEEKKIDTSMEASEEEVSLEDVNLTTPIHKPHAQPVLTSEDLVGTHPSSCLKGSEGPLVDDPEGERELHGFHGQGDETGIGDVEQEQTEEEREIEYDVMIITIMINIHKHIVYIVMMMTSLFV
jgi:hypothetical protein